MKRTFILLAMVAAVWSCSNNTSSSNDQKTDSGAGTATGPGSTSETATAATDVTQSPEYKAGLALIGKNDCLTCHRVTETVVGPAYAEVAKRYAGKPGIEDSLANKIIHGGSGNWGQNVMSAHQNLSHEDAVTMVKYILLLKQQ